MKIGERHFMNWQDYAKIYLGDNSPTMPLEDKQHFLKMAMLADKCVKTRKKEKEKTKEKIFKLFLSELSRRTNPSGFLTEIALAHTFKGSKIGFDMTDHFSTVATETFLQGYEYILREMDIEPSSDMII